MTRWATCAVCSARVLDAAFRNRNGRIRPILLDLHPEGPYTVARILAGTPLVVRGTEGDRYDKHACRKAA